MANIKDWLLNAEEKYGEPIEAIIVGPHYRRYYDDILPYPDENVVLDRAAGLAKLKEEYDNGYGGADCYPMYAYAKSRVFFIGEYDGATGLAFVPRHPIECKPELSGNDVDN